MEKISKTFDCVICGQSKPTQTDGGTGYAIDKDNNKICYACCGDRDKQELINLKPKEKTCMYLDGNNRLSNWPGTFVINNVRTRKGYHNIAGARIDVWFTYSTQNYHGVLYGHNTQICHIQRVK